MGQGSSMLGLEGYSNRRKKFSLETACDSKTRGKVWKLFNFGFCGYRVYF